VIAAFFYRHSLACAANAWLVLILIILVCLSRLKRWLSGDE
jgi:hypothetical protein